VIFKNKRQDELNDYIVEELKELRYLIQQANSDHAKERDNLWNAIKALRFNLDSRTEHLA